MKQVQQETVIVSTDLDGTLLGRGQHDISDVLPQLLEEATRGSGGRLRFVWVINTGRRYEQIHNLVQRAALCRRPDYIVDRETFLHRLHDGGYVPVAEWNDRAERRVRAVEQHAAPHIAAWVERLKQRYEGIIVRLDSGVPVSVQCTDFAQGMAVHDTLLGLTSDVPNRRVVRNGVWVSIWAQGCDKGTLLNHLSAAYAVPTQCIMAVGDSVNDLPMLHGSVAGWPVAPANAEEQVKQFVVAQKGYVSPEPDIDGVVDGFSRFVARLRAR